MKNDKILQTEEPACAPARCHTNPPHRILLVDDDISIRELSTDVLIRFGYHVDAAEDGAAAWEVLQSKAYNLIITDNSMPRMTGVELIKKLRSARMALPVIMVSGIMPTEELNGHPWLQLAATLPKPFSPEQLLTTVHDVLRTNDRAREQIELPIWQCQPSADPLCI